MAWLDFAICLFFGMIGAHKFKEKKILWGIIYLLTCGLFGIGWIYDCIKYFVIAVKGSKKTDIQRKISNKTVKKKNGKKLFLWIPVVFLIFIVSVCMLLSEAIDTDIPNTYSDSSSSLSSSTSYSSSQSSSKAETSPSQSSSKAETSSSQSSSKVETSSSQSSSKAETSSSQSSNKVETSSSSSSSSKSTGELIGSGLQIISYPKTVRRNEIGTVVIQGKPNTVYSISVYYKSGISKAEGLESKTSDANGKVSWSWKVGSKTSEGTFKIVVSGGGESKTVNFTVEK